MPLYKQELVSHEPKRDTLSSELKLLLLNDVLKRLDQLFHASARGADQQLVNAAYQPLLELKEALESEMRNARPRP